MGSPENAGNAEPEGVNAVQRKFREALDRKQAQRSGDAAAGGDGQDRGKSPGAHGPARTQRQFRRKSGG